MPTIHGLFQKPVVYCKYLDQVLKYYILEIFGFGIMYCVLQIFGSGIMYCVILYIYMYIVNTLQDGVGTPPGATKIVEIFFILFF